MRKTLTTALAVLLAVFTLGSLADAAPRKIVHRRARHSARVVHRTVHRAPAKKVVKRVAHAPARTAKHVAARRSTKPR